MRDFKVGDYIRIKFGHEEEVPSSMLTGRWIIDGINDKTGILFCQNGHKIYVVDKDSVELENKAIPIWDTWEETKGGEPL